jgi:phospholipid/cholesterol/gamma-HCH transport system substrate-binding protein
VKRIIPIVAGAAVLVLVAVLLVALLGGGRNRTVTAFFPRAVGLYQGTSVRILGVPVGKVTSVQAEGDRVKVVMEYSSKYKVPADAAAVSVPPSIVSDRYVQLAPAYTGGPTMPDGAVIPENRTEVPLELDEIFKSLNDLNVALGPNGANKQGALSRLIDVGAANLSGNGQRLHDSLTNLSQAISTLSENRGDFFGTIKNLQQFTTALAQNDGGVRAVNQDLAAVSVQLNAERQDLAAALRNLSIGLTQVAAFVHDNRASLTQNIGKLTAVSSGLVKERRAIEETLDLAPLALQNLALAYDPSTHTLRTRNNNEQGQSGTDPTNPVCQWLIALGQKCSGPPAPGASSAPKLPDASASLLQLLGVGQ